MKTFPKDIQFRKSWRSYQKRLLSELQDHLHDNHLHVIAAPGSGKTVLGLEVARRLNQPTLILAPTVAIRDQWVDRLVGMFCDPGIETPDWISKEIRDPRFLTVSTYQGLHSAYADSEPEDGQGKEALGKKLQELEVRTLVLDEAHHLRNEWWRCLIDLKRRLGKPTVVALTATAPFDVSPLEWDRYISLCGPVDAEIMVPELVRQKNLCPHQDYVYLSAPLRAEREEIREFRAKVSTFAEALRADLAFIEALENLPCVRQPEAHIDRILADPAYYSSIAFFLNALRRKPSGKLLRIIGYSRGRCPEFDLEWLEILLTGTLYAHAKAFDDRKDLLARIGRDLKRIGAIERRTVNLRNTRQTAKLLTRSVSKLRSIEEIIEIEQASLGDDLRMVVLTDYIRKEDIPNDAGDLQDLKRLGVVPIFEHIRRSAIDGVRLGVLTGTLVIVPSNCRQQLQDLAANRQIAPDRLTCKPLAHDEHFCEVTLSGDDKQKIVTLITDLFGQGGITVLVGTASLLGEGWDAPSVNALILASFVGSFMLSNQMRGRAIRTLEGCPLKTANIWHLVCQEDGIVEAGQDLDTLTRRFKAFVGLSFKKTAIESGLGRLGIGKPPYDQGRIDRINAVMTRQARDRDGLRTQWELALGIRKIAAMREVVTTSQLALPRGAILAGAMWIGVGLIVVGGLSAVALSLQASPSFAGQTATRGLLIALGVAAAVAALALLPKFCAAVWLSFWHRSAASSMKQIGKALLKALTQVNAFETEPSQLRVVADRRDFGFVTCSLKGGTTRDRSVFLSALEELLGPIDNPRYILIRKSILGPLMRSEYYAVPNATARNKDQAENFRKMCAKHMGPCACLYTRNAEGHQLLLKAQAQSLSSKSQHRTERVRFWH